MTGRSTTVAAIVLAACAGCMSDSGTSPSQDSPAVKTAPPTAPSSVPRPEAAAELTPSVEPDCRGRLGTVMVGHSSGQATSPHTAEARLRLYLRHAQRLDPEAEGSQEKNYVRLKPRQKYSAVFVGLRDDGSVFKVLSMTRSRKGGWGISDTRGCSVTPDPTATERPSPDPV